MTHATVRDWDPEVGGSAHLDDGHRVALPPECLTSSVFRFLRSGQRIRLELDPDGTVCGVGLP